MTSNAQYFYTAQYSQYSGHFLLSACELVSINFSFPPYNQGNKGMKVLTWFAQNHVTGKLQSWDLRPGSLMPRFEMFIF